MNTLAKNLRKGLGALTTRRVQIQSDGIPYHFTNVSRKKIINACLGETSLYFKPSRPWAMPAHLQVEPSTRCNLHCALCPVSSGLKRPQGFMDFELFTKSIDQTGDHVFTLLLWDWGEPFLNPSIFEMIDSARRKDLRVACSTNGHLFADPRMAERVVQSKLDTLIFAVDGVTQETYARYRQGGNLERVLSGIRNVVAQKQKLGVSGPLINFRFIVMRHNEHEVPRLREVCRSLGVDALTLKTLNHRLHDPYWDDQRTGRVEDEMIPRESGYQRFRTVQPGGQAIRRKHNPCKQFWNTPCLHWEGSVVPCTFDPEDRFKLGDLKRQSFREIWTGDAYSTIRRAFRRNWGQMELCGECSYAYEGGSLNCETMAEVTFMGRAKGL
jgi:radical SAM protein with 4Fe4S-binding SPASM domain